MPASARGAGSDLLVSTMAMTSRPGVFGLALGVIAAVIAGPLQASPTTQISPHQGESPPGKTVSPASPTAADVISFTLNANGVTYSNDCRQLQNFAVWAVLRGRTPGDHLVLNFDWQSRLIRLQFAGTYQQRVCPEVYMPVNGLEGRVGPLTPGLWTIEDTLFSDSISFTVRPHPADFNEDGAVDAADFLAWQRGLGATEGAQHGDGDADGNGQVNAADLEVWQQALAASGPATAVPEPSHGMAIVAAATFFARRRGLQR